VTRKFSFRTFRRVPGHYTPKSLLLRAFTAEELRYLDTHASFRAALSNVQTLSDFEYACELGNELIVQRSMHVPRMRGCRSDAAFTRRGGVKQTNER
jgi:hypothetical protein